jgi:hypothetical protein
VRSVVLHGSRFALAVATASIAVGAGVAQAAAPSVSVTNYSPTIHGNIGTATAGVSVTVRLERDGTTVATTPAATTDANGDWTATLSGHAPSNAADRLDVEYGGTGAPSVGAQYTFSPDGLESAVVAADGSSVAISCDACTGGSLPVHVVYSDGSSDDVTAVPTGTGYAASLSPPVAASDVVTYTGSVTEADLAGNPTTLQLNNRASLPGQVAPPACAGDLSLGAATCFLLPDGQYDVKRIRSGSETLSQTATSSGGELTTTFPDLSAGDQLQVVEHGGTVAITTAHLASLQALVKQTGYGSTQNTAFSLTGGKCIPGAWLPDPSDTLGPDEVCPATGDVPAASSFAFRPLLVSLDDLSPGATTVTPSALAGVSPLDGEDVFGPTLVAFAAVSGAKAKVALTYGPLGGNQTPAVGDPTSSTGAEVTGLAPGTRYAASWVATDTAGDATTLSTVFNDQSGVTGPPGPIGPIGPPGFRSVSVICKLVKRHRRIVGTRCTAKVKLSRSRAVVALRLTRGRTVYAVGRGTVPTNSGDISLHLLRPLAMGRYALSVVITRSGRTVTDMGVVRVVRAHRLVRRAHIGLATVHRPVTRTASPALKKRVRSATHLSVASGTATSKSTDAGSSSPHPTAPVPGAATANAAARAEASNPSTTLITFSEYPVGTVVTNQYKNKGIVFDGDTSTDTQFITTDGSNPTSPVLSGTPLFTGDVGARFVVPGTAAPATVNSVSLDVGYIDNPGSTIVTAYGSNGGLLGTVVASQTGINHLTLAFPGIARFLVESIGSEPAGFAIDNVAFTASGFTLSGSLPAPTKSTSPDDDLATGSPALARQCGSVIGQIYYHLAELDAHSSIPIFFNGVGAPTAASLLEHFVEGSGRSVGFLDGSTVSQEAKSDPAVKSLDNKVQTYAAQQARNGAKGTINVKPIMTKPTLGDNSNDLYWGFRGTQGIDVSGAFNKVGNRFIGTVTYVLRDNYGFGANDKFPIAGQEMHFLQTECGAPDYPDGAHWFPDSITITRSFSQPG